MSLDILIVNLNCLQHTKNLIWDLNQQRNKRFNVTLVDQNSVEEGTKEFLDKCPSEYGITVIRNDKNESLNKVWNQFVKNSRAQYISILNNDIRIPRNFVSDLYGIFEKEPNVGAVIHPTNHPNFCRTKPELDYRVLEPNRFMQGWDICMRRDAWVYIPPQLRLYCGDDFVYEHMYGWGYDIAIALSSPIIHYQGQTTEGNKYNIHVSCDWSVDVRIFTEMGYPRHLHPPHDFTILQFKNSPVERIEEYFDVSS